MIHHPDDILGDSGLIVIQGHELAVPLEAGVVRFDSGTPRFLPGEPEPRCERRPAALGEDLCEGRKGAPDVVEDPVEQNSQPATVRGAQQGVKIGLVAEARIDPEMVDRVVPMSRRSEDGAEREARRPQFHRVIQPRFQLRQAMGHACPSAGFRFGADETERIDLPPDRVPDPLRRNTSRAGRISHRPRRLGAGPRRHRRYGQSGSRPGAGPTVPPLSASATPRPARDRALPCPVPAPYGRQA